MPIFEYRCSSCGRELEHLVLESSRAPTCSSCGSHDLERIMSRSAVSSEHTQARATRGLRAKNRALRQDHSREEVKRVAAHAADHDE
ncbi:MAG: zinc ribbon domain-containing protein [Gemmatimonadetes bacterium]|nr:zinc ribbon domain-containing protein [Gemmatimonadota bacterium]